MITVFKEKDINYFIFYIFYYSIVDALFVVYY